MGHSEINFHFQAEDDDDEEMLEDPSDCLLPPSLDADEDGGICEVI